MRVIKKEGAVVRAWRLGDGSDMERELIRQGRIRVLADGRYAVLSRETDGENGQIVGAGDYFKVDGGGFPYPNTAAFFEENHVHLEGDRYRQLPRPLEAWESGEPASDALRWLLDRGRLRLHEEDPARYYEAELWGTTLTAAKDAVLVFYDTVRDGDGHITDVTFNFVAAEEFRQNYDRL